MNNLNEFIECCGKDYKETEYDILLKQYIEKFGIDDISNALDDEDTTIEKIKECIEQNKTWKELYENEITPQDFI